MTPVTRKAVPVGVAVVVAALVAGAAPPVNTPPTKARNLVAAGPEELAKVRIPTGARLESRRVSARILPLVGKVVGPDLIVLDPVYEAGPKQAPPGFSGIGYYVDFGVQNQGNRPSGPTTLRVDCEVVNGGAGGNAQWLASLWCNSFNQKPHMVPGLQPGEDTMPTGPYAFLMGVRIYIGSALFPCDATHPRPKYTVTVDPENKVAETTVGETNNVYVAELCYTQ